MRYARALFWLASAHGQLERVRAEAASLAREIAATDAIERVICSPHVEQDSKMQLVGRCVGGGEMSPEFARFVYLVLVNGREEHLRTMCLSFAQLVKESMGITDALVTVATEPGAAGNVVLHKELERLTGRKVNMSVNVDPAIIGGYVLRWDDYRLDRSVRSSLQYIEKQLTGRQS